MTSIKENREFYIDMRTQEVLKHLMEKTNVWMHISRGKGNNRSTHRRIIAQVKDAVSLMGIQFEFHEPYAAPPKIRSTDFSSLNGPQPCNSNNPTSTDSCSPVGEITIGADISSVSSLNAMDSLRQRALKLGLKY